MVRPTLLRLVLCGAVFFSGADQAAFAHGGGLNSSGCHNERRTGGYHCHRSGGSSTPQTPLSRLSSWSNSTPTSAPTYLQITSLPKPRRVKASSPDDGFETREAIRQVIGGYFGVKSWQARLPFVHDADVLKDCMSQHYGSTSFPVDHYKPALLDFAFIDIKKGEVGMITTSLAPGRSALSTYFVLHAEEGYKILWEESVLTLCNQTSIKELERARAAKPAEVKVIASATGRYKHAFTHAQSTHISLLIGDDPEARSLYPRYAYVNRESDLGKYIERYTAVMGKSAVFLATLSLKEVPTRDGTYARGTFLVEKATSFGHFQGGGVTIAGFPEKAPTLPLKGSLVVPPERKIGYPEAIEEMRKLALASSMSTANTARSVARERNLDAGRLEALYLCRYDANAIRAEVCARLAKLYPDIGISKPKSP